MSMLKYGMMTEQDFRANWLPEPYIPPISDDEDIDLPTAVEGKPKSRGKDKDKGKTSSVGAVGTKRCTKCGEIRPVKDFRPHDTTADGLAAYCRFCQNQLNKNYRDKNVVMRIKHHFATRVADQFKGAENLPKGYTEKLEDYLGYNLATLVETLDMKLHEEFPDTGHNTLSALKDGWHIDHIRPLRLFPTKVIGDTEFRKCWAPSNLRVIPAEDNLAKGSTFNE